MSSSSDSTPLGSPFLCLDICTIKGILRSERRKTQLLQVSDHERAPGDLDVHPGAMVPELLFPWHTTASQVVAPLMQKLEIRTSTVSTYRRH
jgi:hypothetical protein